MVAGDLEILLDNQWNTYFEGQVINGQVRVSVESPKKLQGIHIRFLGEAVTEWSETRTTTDAEGKSHTEKVRYGTTEEYFNRTQYFLGAPNGPTIELPSGTYTYPFSYTLPSTLPSSFEGPEGHIRYTIKATLDPPRRFGDEVKIAFTVISPVDLNLNSRLKKPAILGGDKTFCCMCCESGPIEAVVLIPATGYVSGQNIPMNIEVNNASEAVVDSVDVILRQVITYKDGDHSMSDCEDIISMTVGSVGTESSKDWDAKFLIPPSAPSNLAFCNIIDLRYYLALTCTVSGPHTNLDGHMPITLGTIPLVSAPPNYVPYKTNTPLAPIEPSAPEAAIALSATPKLTMETSYPDVPEPAFCESAYRGKLIDKTDSEYTRAAADFAPRYPTYNDADLSGIPK